MIVICLPLITLNYNLDALADENISESVKVLVVYSSLNGEIDEHQRMLDMLIGRFTEEIEFRSTLQFTKDDLNDVSHLFYYGYEKEILPENFLHYASNFSGVMVGIGYNLDQLGDRFSFLEIIPNEVIIDQIVSGNNPEQYLTYVPSIIINTYTVTPNTNLILIGKYGDNEYPLCIQYQNTFYFASTFIKPPFSIAFGEVLHKVFESSDTMIRPGYIRLEDIHPLVDPKNLIEIAEILKEKKIPYMVSVIPVYTNPETGKQYHFSDSPKLLKVLKYMQNNGGSIVLHGYTHQFRLSETGEGFEFWDVENNMPIYHNQYDEVIVKTKEDFLTEEDYIHYINQQKSFERNYIEKRLTRGVQELVNFGLFPLAFEAPHYTMSQHGYQVASQFFSTYVGQLQLSDDDWEIMTTAPYITKPSFLNGMTLLPETIGYVIPNDPQAIKKMIDEAKEYQFLRDGMISGFYHSYLGVDLFVELIQELERLPNISWIDLRQFNNRVSVDNIEIKTENGNILSEINHIGLFLSSGDYIKYHVIVLIHKILWCLVGIGTIAVIFFTYNIFITSARIKARKRGEEID